jgi:hypothetical protein
MWGEITCEEAMKCSEECHSTGNKLGILKFLVDATEARNVESALKNYYFAYKDLDASQVDKRARVALLVDPGDTSHDFLETLCRNAGHDVTLFRERELAERHLHYGPQINRKKEGKI